MGIGPSLDPTGLSYYNWPDHLRTNRTKNRRPGYSKTLVCNILKDADYPDPVCGHLQETCLGRGPGSATTSIRAGTAADKTSRDPSDSVLGLCYMHSIILCRRSIMDATQPLMYMLCGVFMSDKFNHERRLVLLKVAPCAGGDDRTDAHIPLSCTCYACRT